MDEETKSPFPDSPTSPTKDSSIFGLSSRSLIVFMICGTVCYIYIFQCMVEVYVAYMMKTPINFKIEEPLYSLVIMTVGYYFGQNQKQQQKQ